MVEGVHHDGWVVFVNGTVEFVDTVQDGADVTFKCGPWRVVRKKLVVVWKPVPRIVSRNTT